jgi:hypothetical protein
MNFAVQPFGSCAMYGGEGKRIHILLGISEGPWSRWYDNAEMDLKVMKWNGEDQSNLTQYRDKCRLF